MLIFALHIYVFLSGLFLSLQPTRSVTPRLKDVVSPHRKTKEVLVEQKIALVGPLSEAGKLDGHGDRPLQLPRWLHLAAHHRAGINHSSLSLQIEMHQDAEYMRCQRDKFTRN